ncbi:hypothetical protein HPP92_023761 [Vanilla planifolia]|uniref:NAC domain-containing protein n=1 Tax=Vanilla planifolia TaxID=51239 RepID=A0A835UCZ2_VANPL|nr:hypothetical protein HPP92_024103 [Vanilla planifolia]KAG0455973.1 hypothetical protein HPP92_023761 [Vanilla planifolia]
MDEGLPPGFRFHPSDEELVTYYLTRKVSDFGFSTKAITDVDLNKCEPWDLPGKASMGEKEWYFFSLKDRKYPTGMRTNRATDAGYWKTTGKDKEIFHYGMLIGMKKTLVFYKGRAPRGEKTNWVMHEYRLQNKYPYKPSKEEWVVCRIFKKSSIFHMKRSLPGSPSMPMLLESPIGELGEIDLPMANVSNPSWPFNPMQAMENSTAIESSGGPKMDLNLYMNWMYGRPEGEGQSFAPPWPANLLNSSAVPNPAILKALQLGNYLPMEVGNAAVSSVNSFVEQGDGFFATHEAKHAESAQGQQQEWRGY